MKRNIILIISFMLVLLLALPGVQSAEEGEDILTGNFSIGYRGVDIEGTESKYKEDYNLKSGPKLLSFNLSYQPAGKLKSVFDRLDIKVYHLGGDPFESFSFNMVKYGKFDLKLERRKSNYYYKDMFIGHDLHHYNFDRINDSASLKLWLCKASKLYFSFNNYTKKGNSTTSFDISHEEYELEVPIDESSKEMTLGIDLNLKNFTFLLEEKIQDYKNDYNLLLISGMNQQGEDPYDSIMLNYYMMSQPYDFRSFTHTFRMSAKPSDKLLVKAVAQLSDQDMRLDYSESMSGVSYRGLDFSSANSGEGSFSRKIGMYEVDISYLINYNMAFVGSVRYHDFDQEGTFDVYGQEMPLNLDYNTLGLEAGLQYQASSKFTLTLGVRNETREVNHAIETEVTNDETKRTGFFGNVKLNLSKKLKLTADYQYGTYTDPFTSISPTDYHRARFTAKYKGKNMYFNGSFLYKLSENDLNNMWKNERAQLSLRTGYYNKKFKLGLGYSLIYSKNEGDRDFNFYGSSVTWNILNEGRANLFDLYLKFLLNKKFTAGIYGNYYKNDGYWEIERLIVKPFVEYKFEGGFVGKLSYSLIDFKEIEYGNNNYNADIFEISFGYRW